MMTGEAHQKVTARHLKRKAYLYVRQSTLRQVMENTESTERQYALRQRAVALGWPQEQIVVIDCDQGHSGASAEGRGGFQQLVGDVGMGLAGIVMGLEVSRLARNSSDWHRLLEICALSDTLILDEDGVYDPAHFNDRLLLGLKGTMSEAELHVLRARLRDGIISKARRGELESPLPIGFRYDANNRVVLDPDKQVQETIRTFFQTFRRTGSATATVKAFRMQGLRFPRRARSGSAKGEVIWGELEHSRTLWVLHNPRFAGAFFFGRTRLAVGHSAAARFVAVARSERHVARRGSYSTNLSGGTTWSAVRVPASTIDVRERPRTGHSLVRERRPMQCPRPRTGISNNIHVRPGRALMSPIGTPRAAHSQNENASPIEQGQKVLSREAERIPMLRSLTDLEQYKVRATDGDIGTVVNFLLDDEQWAIRYLVVKTGGFFNGSQVLVSPIFFRQADWNTRQFHLALTMDKIKNSPSVYTDLPVSRQFERDYYRYYDYPYYWAFSDVWGAGEYPRSLEVGGWNDRPEQADDQHRDARLRSAKEVTGYQIHGNDGVIGHVTDFRVDDETWEVRYLVVDTAHWWAEGMEVLVSPYWATSINWGKREVHVDLTRQAIKNSPAWNPAEAINREYEERLRRHYGRPGHWDNWGFRDEPRYSVPADAPHSA